MPLPERVQKIIEAKLQANPTVSRQTLMLEMRRQTFVKLWRKGDLRFKFHATQRRIYDALSASKERQFFLLCSRRLGKTFMLLTMAFQECLQKPGARVLFLAPQARDAAEIATDTAAQILKDAPAEIRQGVDYKAQTKEFHFPNGSILRLKGVNAEQADNLRGGATDLVILDEAGQMDNLDYLLKSVVLPMTLTTGGRIYLATTPPVTPDHESKLIYDRLFALNATVKFTILDAPHVPNAAKAEMLTELGEDPAHVPAILAGTEMPKTTAALRELFAEFVTDASMKVVPEFDAEAKKEIVRFHPRPAYFDAYVAVDPGFNDRTGLVFAHYDFTSGKIVIEGERLLHKASTNDIANAIMEMEYKLWGDQRPLLRVSDVDPRLIADLAERHGLIFAQAQKQDSLGAINLVRTMVRNREIGIQPDCVQTIHQLENTIWNKKASDFERTTEGHGDLLAAVKYLCRSVLRHHDPRPAGARGPYGADGMHRSPRRRFWKGRDQQLDLLGKTPFGKRVRRKRNGQD